MSILKTTIKEEAMERKNGLPPIHPGEIIKEDILPSTGLSVTAVAKALGVSRQMLHDILAGRKPLSTVMCLKVSRLFGGSPELWMRLQGASDHKPGPGILIARLSVTYSLFRARQPRQSARPNANLVRGRQSEGADLFAFPAAPIRHAGKRPWTPSK